MSIDQFDPAQHFLSFNCYQINFIRRKTQVNFIFFF